MEGHSQLANCVRGKTMALFKPWRYLVSKPPNLDVAKEARILCDDGTMVAPINSICVIRDITRKFGGLKTHIKEMKFQQVSFKMCKNKRFQISNLKIKIL